MGEAVRDIRTQIGEIHPQQLARFCFQLFVHRQHIYQNDDQLDKPAAQRGDGGALDAQLRRAEMPVDQAIVQTDVDADGADGHDGADDGGFDALQRVHQRVGHRKQQIGPANDAQIAHPFVDHGAVVGEQRQHPHRRDLADREKQDADHQPAFHADVDDLLDGLDALLPPILRCQHHNAQPDAGGNLLQRELDLVDQRGTGQRQLGVGAQHQIVRHIHRQRRQLLQCDDRQQREKGAVKRFVFRKNPQPLRLVIRRQRGVGCAGHRNSLPVYSSVPHYRTKQGGSQTARGGEGAKKGKG